MKVLSTSGDHTTQICTIKKSNSAMQQKKEVLCCCIAREHLYRKNWFGSEKTFPAWKDPKGESSAV